MQHQQHVLLVALKEKLPDQIINFHPSAYQTDLSLSAMKVKMTVRGTMVRSEVCNSWCFCLES